MNPESKKSFSGGFLLFLVAMILVIITLQNFMQGRVANVAFSYQLEHLVNLNLLQPEDSRKISLNDNLVTFTGKFRERETEEGKKRFKYLSLLQEHHQLIDEQASVNEQLAQQQVFIRDAADWFLQLSGIPFPAGGYRVVGAVYDTPGRENGIILSQMSDKGITSLSDLEAKLGSVKSSSNAGVVDQFGVDVEELVRNFRAPTLGIGTEPLKQTLKALQKDVLDTEKPSKTLSEKVAVYEGTLTSLREITSELDEVRNHVRLGQLRSVRNYKADLDREQQLVTNLEQNSAQLEKAREAVVNVIWFFNNQELSTRALERQDSETFSHWFKGVQEEWTAFDANRGAVFKAPDQPRNLVLEKTFKSEEPAPNYVGYLFTVMPVILVVLLLYFIFSRQMKGGGGGAMNFGKSPAKLLTKDKGGVTFKDVAGCDEAKEELQEIVEFLKNPGKFTSLGGRIPKGVLCVGPPGTGKTLIARAVAGEADRPFFSISGSDFVEMFVGVGASRIRDMFEQAKKNAPCIIFMDEIDAVGRHRGAGIGGGHDEREQTLNQLLVEMDGFDTNEGVILMAATNRPDVLDKALLRPGRFDRRVILDLPDLNGRYEILKVHARKIKLDPSVDLKGIARGTPGMSGADLANLLNEAALLAARTGRLAVTAVEMAEACDKVRYGKERRSLEVDLAERKTTAYHESGHAIVGLVCKHSDPVHKVTVVPRGFSLGATHFLPEKNRLSHWKIELQDRLAILMGGRVAEEIFVKDVSSGAQQDIREATRLARAMVCEWGMSDKLGLIAYDTRSESGQYLGMTNYQERTYSEFTARAIDEEIQRIMTEAHKAAKDIIIEHRDQVELMTAMLMEFETLDAEDIQKIIKNEWNAEDKKGRVEAAKALHKKPEVLPPPPPPLVEGALKTEVAPAT